MTEEHVRLQRGHISQLIPIVCLIRCDFQCTNSQFKLETWSKMKAKIKIHIRNPSTSNMSCFYLHRCSTRNQISGSASEHRKTSGLKSTNSIWPSRDCSNARKDVRIIDPVFLPGSVLFQASSGLASNCPSLTDGFWKNFCLLLFTFVKQYCNEPRDQTKPSNSVKFTLSVDKQWVGKMWTAAKLCGSLCMCVCLCCNYIIISLTQQSNDSELICETTYSAPLVCNCQHSETYLT